MVYLYLASAQMQINRAHVRVDVANVSGRGLSKQAALTRVHHSLLIEARRSVEIGGELVVNNYREII